MYRNTLLTWAVVALAAAAWAAPAAAETSAEAGTGGVTKGRFVKLSAEGQVVTATAATDAVVGVCTLTASAGDLTRYAAVGERATVTSGEDLALGDLLTAGAGGKAYTVDTDDSSNQRIAAVCLSDPSGADEDTTVLVTAAWAEQRLAITGSVTVTGSVTQAATAGTKTLAGGPVTIVFLPTTGETLSWTVPTGYDLLVLDAIGWKTAAAGDHADDQWDLKNDDGSAANIFDTE